jgi:hypothetical protein
VGAIENEIYNFVTSGIVGRYENPGLILSRYGPAIAKRFSGNQYMFGDIGSIQVKPIKASEGIVSVQKITQGLHFTVIEKYENIGNVEEEPYLIVSPVFHEHNGRQIVKPNPNFKVAISNKCPKIGHKLHAVQLDFSEDGDTQILTPIEIKVVGVVEKIGEGLAYVRDAESWFEYIVSYHSK